MDPRNQLNLMRLQESLPTALDLSMGCRQIPMKASSMEALDLVKKASWIDRNSGTKSRTVGVPESPVPKPFGQGPPDVSQQDPTSGFGYEPRYCALPFHNPSSLPLLDRLAAVAQMPSPCPPLDPDFIEDERIDVGIEKVFTHPSRNPLGRLIAASQNAKTHSGSLRRTRAATTVKNVLNGLDSTSQCSKDCGGQNTVDTVLPRTRSKGFLIPQDSSSPTSSLHSSSSASTVSEDSAVVESTSLAPTQTVVETLSSECSYSDVNSLCSIEYISSDDSDVIEVPVNISTCKNSSSDPLLTAGKISNQKETLSSPRTAFELRYSTDSKRLHTNDQAFPVVADTLDSCDVSSPTVLQDSDPDTDGFVSKSLPSTSDAENADVLKPPQDGEPSLLLSPSSCKKGPPSQRAAPTKRRRRTNSEPKKKSPGKKWSKPSPCCKGAAGPVKRRRKKLWQSGSATSMFPPEEPEIKLKYANPKEEKREGKGDSFVPYIRMEFSACTVVNFQDVDGDVRAKKGRQSLLASAVSGTVPATSCLQLGRLNSDSRSQASQLCCLCGRTANAVGLGDLHGPYYPWGPQADTYCSQIAANHDGELGPMGGEFGRLKKCEEGNPAELLREDCLSEKLSGAPEWGSDGKERWIHEDCSIWSSGVFLVKGKLYGLEEAVRLAKETVCSCCDTAGATLGCFFKGCPTSFHFPCALHAGCSFNEENFTIRCPKHKNKSPRTSLSRLQNR